jgi:hypothetical protein
MERFSDHNDLATALAEIRPAPRSEFAAELDARVAAGFRNPQQTRHFSLTALATRLSFFTPRRFALAGVGAGLVGIVVATALITSNDSQPASVALDSTASKSPHQIQLSKLTPKQAHSATSGAKHGVQAAPEIESFSSSLPSSTNGSAAYIPAQQRIPNVLVRPTRRDVKRAAEINLLADPTAVTADSAKVFRAVHDVDGIVLHSSTTAGTDAGARFEMLIPSTKLGDALAGISAIDEVRYRREASDDITAPTVETGKRLRDSRTRIESLLSQLAGAETGAEREVIEIQLRGERRQAAGLRSQLARLHRRIQYARVQVRIESDPKRDPGGAWGIDDAFHDAGHILGIVAGVTVVGLAVIAPLALLCLLAWLAQRLWLRSRASAPSTRSRRRPGPSGVNLGGAPIWWIDG